MSEPERISFEAGLERLEAIAARLGEAELTVDETIRLLREGKGLEQALRGYLEQAEQELREIEEGRGLTPFAIDRPSDPPATADAD
jgi:exodeoxyribonuclease VII small subunit